MHAFLEAPEDISKLLPVRFTLESTGVVIRPSPGENRRSLSLRKKDGKRQASTIVEETIPIPRLIGIFGFDEIVLLMTLMPGEGLDVAPDPGAPLRCLVRLRPF